MKNDAKPVGAADQPVGAAELYRVRFRAKDRLLRAVWMNSCLALFMFVLMAEIQLARAAGVSPWELVAHNWFKLGIFLPPLLFAVWGFVAAIQYYKRWPIAWMRLEGSRLHFVRPPSNVLMWRERNVIIELTAIDQLQIIDATVGTRLRITVQSVSVAFPLHLLTPNGEEDPPHFDDWSEHPVVKYIEQYSPVPVTSV